MGVRRELKFKFIRRKREERKEKKPVGTGKSKKASMGICGVFQPARIKPSEE